MCGDRHRCFFNDAFSGNFSDDPNNVLLKSNLEKWGSRPVAGVEAGNLGSWNAAPVLSRDYFFAPLNVLEDHPRNSMLICAEEHGVLCGLNPPPPACKKGSCPKGKQRFIECL